MPAVTISAYPAGVNIGLAVTAFLLGLRHGFDWDHIAAIADLTGTAESRKRGFFLSFLYAIGHGLVVFVLGVCAIIFGLAIPEGLDAWMGRIVGLTLIALGAFVLYDLVRNGRNFRLRSRWMLIIGGAFAGLRRVQKGRKISVDHDHPHPHEHDASDAATEHEAAHAHDHAHNSSSSYAEVDETIDLTEPVPADAGRRSFFGRDRSGGEALAGHRHTHTHAHGHSHQLALPDTATASYGGGAATGIGMLHGVGIESPTQIAVFVASSAAVGWGFGVTLLLLWVVGLIVANGVLAVLAGAGVLKAESNFGVYAGLAIIVSIASIGLGFFYLLA